MLSVLYHPAILRWQRNPFPHLLLNGVHRTVFLSSQAPTQVSFQQK